MKSTEVIVEIGRASTIGELQLSDDEIISNSEIVGEIERRDVWEFSAGNQELYFFVTSSNTIAAFALLLGSSIRGVRNISGVRGQVTSLISFVVHTLNRPLKITSDEPLTGDGLDWIVSLIKAGGRGLKLTDQRGNYPNAAAIKDEWYSLDPDEQGPSEIIIEGKTSLRRINQNVGMLMPVYIWIGDNSIL